MLSIFLIYFSVKKSARKSVDQKDLEEVDYKVKKNAEQENVFQEQRAKEKAEYDKLYVGDKVEQEKTQKEAAYLECLNKTYKEDKPKYDEEYSKLIMDEQC